MKIRLLLLFFVCASLVNAQETLSLLFAGDAMGHEGQFQWAYNASTDTYDYEPNFRYVTQYITPATLAIVNLEVTLGGKPYSGYPTFSTPDSYKDALLNCGFDVFLLANNHILDRGKRGLERTLDQLADIPNAGAFRDSSDRAARYPLVMDVQGLKIAVFNCTYGTNGFRPVAPNMVNYIDTAQIRRDMRSLDGQHIDMKIMTIHWGDEYVLKALPKQRKMAQWLADLGFDLIIGGHPHVVEDGEYLTTTRIVNGERVEKQVPVLYSLGNLISNQRREHTNGGIMVRVDIRKSDAGIVNVSYLPCYVHKGSISYTRDVDNKRVTERQFFLIPTPDYLNGRFSFTLDAESDANLKRFHKNTTERLANFPLMK